MTYAHLARSILHRSIPLRATIRPFHIMSTQAVHQGGTSTNANRPALPPDVAANTARIGKHTAAETDEYLTSKLAPKGQWAADPALERCRQRAQDARIPAIEVSAMQGQWLAVLAKGIKAEKILELGTLWGYSTFFLTRALPSHGQIDTLELSPVHAQVAQQNFLDLDLYPFPKVHIGDALQTLRDPKGAFAQPPGAADGLPEDAQGYDLVFIDADKERMMEYFTEALRLTKKGGTIVVDNAIRGGRIVTAENETPAIDVTGLRKLFDWVEQDAGKTLLMSGIQTVGAKNWDGFLQAIKL